MGKEICTSFTTFFVCTGANTVDKLVQHDKRFASVAPSRLDGDWAEKEAVGMTLRAVFLILTFRSVFGNGQGATSFGIVGKISFASCARDIRDSDVEAEVLPALEMFNVQVSRALKRVGADQVHFFREGHDIETVFGEFINHPFDALVTITLFATVLAIEGMGRHVDAFVADWTY